MHLYETEPLMPAGNRTQRKDSWIPEHHAKLLWVAVGGEKWGAALEGSIERKDGKWGADRCGCGEGWERGDALGGRWEEWGVGCCYG